MEEAIFSPTDFVAILNQALEFAYPSIMIQGELANFRISKNRWVYFDLKDEYSSVKFFGTVYQLPGPLEDGMLVQVRGLPRLHQQYGFSVNVQFMQPVGEGSLKKAAALLEAKLTAEGLFNPERKRPLPYPPRKIGLIASGDSAAYHDFIKILNERWAGVEVRHADVQVQGELATGQIVQAIDYFNTNGDGLEALVITRGGGSPEDLAAFSTEQVTRAVAGSRVPTIVAIGHEVDISLAELAADQRASTPSNAAELLVPDKKHVSAVLLSIKRQLGQQLITCVHDRQQSARDSAQAVTTAMERILQRQAQTLELRRGVLLALSPEAALKRGYAIIRKAGTVIRSSRQLKTGDELSIHLRDGAVSATVKGKL